MKNIFIKILPLLVLTSIISAQDSRWLLIFDEPTEKLYIDVTDVEVYKGDDFYVWAMQKVNPPFKIETVPGDIYQVKTYYHFNKKLQKYAIQSIIYYDENGNVLKVFNYNNGSVNDDYKFNFPILPNSSEEKIFSSFITLQKNN